MNPEAKDSLSQLDDLLSLDNQAWLFGAGISLDAGLPLMWALTDRVLEISKKQEDPQDFKVLDSVKNTLSSRSHIEHILSQLGDYRAIADRSKGKNTTIGEISLSVNELEDLHKRVLGWIAETIRWGYKAKENQGAEEQIGTKENRIIQINNHLNFVSALFNRSQAGVAERRRAVRVFTTNYDTLLEDALALGGFSYWDGFSGGAVAYRDHRYGDTEPTDYYRAHVIKLHGSIDWHLGKDGRVLRVREEDCYPDKVARVLIYPQATKYLETQRDPFAAQFDLFRRSLGAHEENILATCGYSFGDEHINQEIELTLQRPENKTTILAFAQNLNSTLTRWRNQPWGNRVHVITENGLYFGKDKEPYPKQIDKLGWWTFDGVTKILNSGAEASVL